MKKIVLLGLIMLNMLSSFAQNEVDVLRYSEYKIGGTARSLGMGTGIGSMGADFTSLWINPAGSGLYRKNELVITPTIYFSNVDAVLNNYKSDGFKDNFNLNNVGIVLTSPTGNTNGVKFVQFAFGLNRTNNYNQLISIDNMNNTSSLMTDYQVNSYGLYPDQLDAFGSDLAWYNFLLEDTVRDIYGNLAYTSPLASGGVYQQLRKDVWGSVNEMVISSSLNFNDVLYLGGGIGIPFSRYFEESTYTESDPNYQIADFDHFVLNQYLETHGSGFNFKLGMIFRPTGFLRVGFSYHSPTWYSMSDYYHSKLTRHWEDRHTTFKNSPEGFFDYSIRTPMKIIGSTTITLFKKLIISADVDYINYSNANLSAPFTDYSDANEQVRVIYSGAVNIRGGAEYAWKNTRWRLGLAHYDSPYESGVNDASRMVYSGGLGYVYRDYFFDMAFAYSDKTEDYYMYDSRLIDPASLNTTEYRILITAGVKF
jgi:hypothetical protein